MSMKRASSRLCTVLLLLVAFPESQFAAADDGSLEAILSAGALKIAVYRNLAPYSYSNKTGQFVGIDVEIGRELAARLGVSLSLMPFTADENMGDDLRNFLWKGHYLGGGVADVMLHVPVDAAFAEENDQVRFFAPYFREAVSIAHRPKNDAKIFNLAALVDQTIGVELDTISDYFLSSSFGGRFREQARRYLSVQEAVAALSENEIDAVMAPKGELQGALHIRGNAEHFRVQEMHLGEMFRNTWNVGVGVKAGNDSLAAGIESALAEMKADNAMSKIFAKYGVTLVSPTDAN